MRLPQMIIGMNRRLMPKDIIPHTINMFVRLMPSSQGVMAKGIGMLMALRTKVIPTNASAVSYREISRQVLVDRV